MGVAMNHSARSIVGFIYLILALMWTTIILILVSGAGTAKLLGAFRDNADSWGAYALISLLLGCLLLSKRLYRKQALKIILILALVPMIAAPFVATDFFGAIIYLIPYLFVYRFYKDDSPAPQLSDKVVKFKRT